MKAYIYSYYGELKDNLILSEVNRPKLADDKVLIKVRATSINRPDWYRLIGWPQLVRLQSGIFKPKKSARILGSDISGTVEAVGKNVTTLKVGDEIYGEITYGGFAEYAVTKPSKVAVKPSNLSYVEAAAIPLTGMTALQALRKLGEINTDSHILLNGASGGVGHYAVQVAKSYGATVTAVCGTDAVEMVSALGADNIIDYKKDETIPEHQFDGVVDIVGNFTLDDYRRYTKDSGRGVMVGFKSFKNMRPLLLLGKRHGISVLTSVPNTEDLDYLCTLAETGKLRPVVYSQYEFSDLPKAMQQFMDGHTNGKIVVKID